MNKKLVSTIIHAALLLPVAAMAFNPGEVPNAAPSLTVNQLVDLIFAILWPVAVAFFIIMFIMASFQFFTAQGDPEGIAKARNFVLWGIVGVVVALLAFSIPFIVRNTLGNGI